MKKRLALLLGFLVIGACIKDVEEKKVYVLSKASMQLHVLHTESLFSTLAQPLDFSGVGAPKRLGINPAHHQLLIVLENSNTLVRIGTEPPFFYTPLAFTTYGSGESLVAAEGNPAQKTSVVLSALSLFLIDDFGNTVLIAPTPTPGSSPTPTPTPTPSPSGSPTATPTPFLTPTPTPVGAAVSGAGTVALPAGCGPSSFVFNLAAIVKGSGTTSATTSSSPTPAPTASSSPSTSPTPKEESDFFGSGNNVKYVGGDQFLVACRDSNRALIYDATNLQLLSNIALATNARPFAVGFLRTVDETGDTVTGTYAVWNENNTLDLVSSATRSLVSGSSFLITSAATNAITNFGFNAARGFFLTGFLSGGAGFVDVRDQSGLILQGSPFPLPVDCNGTGPTGLSTEAIEFDLDAEQIDLGFPELDLLIYYSCPNTGLVGGFSTNLQTTYLSRVMPGAAPKTIIANDKLGVLYVALTGATAPAPGVIALNKKDLTNAFFPPAVTFTGALPDQIYIVP